MKQSPSSLFFLINCSSQWKALFAKFTDYDQLRRPPANPMKSLLVFTIIFYEILKAVLFDNATCSVVLFLKRPSLLQNG